MKMRFDKMFKVPAHAFYDEGTADPAPDPFDLNAALQNPEAKKKIEDWAEREIASGLKTKNAELLDKLTGYKVTAEDGSETYIDPQRAAQAIEFMDGEGKDIGTKVEAAVKEANERAANQVKSLEGQLEKSNKNYETERSARIGMMMDYELKNALLESGIKTGKLPMHQMYLKSLVTVEVDENGRESIIIKGDDGNMRYGKDGPMSLREFIDEYRDKDDIADDWEADVISGSGQQQGDGVRQRGPKIDQTLSPQERLRQYRASQRKRA